MTYHSARKSLYPKKKRIRKKLAFVGIFLWARHGALYPHFPAKWKLWDLKGQVQDDTVRT